MKCRHFIIDFDGTLNQKDSQRRAGSLTEPHVEIENRPGVEAFKKYGMAGLCRAMAEKQIFLNLRIRI